MINNLGYSGISPIFTTILTTMYTITILGIWIYLIVKFVKWIKYKKALEKIPKALEKIELASDSSGDSKIVVAQAPIRIKFKVETSEVLKQNPVLAKGEICLEYPSDGNIGLYNIKSGNGIATWNQLPYVVKNF